MSPLTHFVPHHLGDYLRLIRDFLPGLIATGIAVRTWLKHRAALSWPTAQGTVWSAHAREGRRGERAKWVAELIYSYTVNGEYFSGTRGLKTRNEEEADRVAAEWKGRAVSVRYAHSDPSDSVLLLEDQLGGTTYQ
jgi:hypothetical protein